MLKPKTYVVLDRAIADGVAYGITAAYKHTDKPTTQQIQSHVYTAVMHEMFEWFDIVDVNHLQDDTDVL